MCCQDVWKSIVGGFSSNWGVELEGDAAVRWDLYIWNPGVISLLVIPDLMCGHGWKCRR